MPNRSFRRQAYSHDCLPLLCFLFEVLFRPSFYFFSFCHFCVVIIFLIFCCLVFVRFPRTDCYAEFFFFFFIRPRPSRFSRYVFILCLFVLLGYVRL